jgi:Spy/CpxP family protein refolding chaperone
MQSMKNLMRILTIFGALLITMATGFAQEQQSANQGRGEHGKRGSHHKDHHMLGRLAHHLNLTDAQKTQIKQITDRYKESTKPLREQIHANRYNLLEQLNNGTFDETKARVAAQARANAEVELEVIHARMFAEIYSVLTAEQKAKLAELKQRHGHKNRGHRRHKPQGAADPNAAG